MQIKAAHFSFEYPPSTTGGLGTYLLGLVEHQRMMGDIIDVFFLGESNAPDGTLPFPFYKDGKLFSYNLEQINQLNNHREYDVIVCHDWAGILASQPIWKKSTPLVTTCHLPLAWDIGYYEDLPCKFASELEFFSMAQSDLIIAVSNSVKQHLEDYFSFTKGKISVVHNGTDTTFFSPGVKSEELILLYVGRFFEQKGFDLLPEIFFLLKKKHPALLLKVIGVGPLKIEIYRKFEELDLINSVHFYDFSPPKMVLELYREATAVIMPSRHEPFGLVAIESMATGTPIIASNTGGLKEIITHGEDGFLVETKDINGFVDTVSRLIYDKQLFNYIGRNARAKAIKNFDQKLCFEKTRNLYLELCSNSRQR